VAFTESRGATVRKSGSGWTVHHGATGDKIRGPFKSKDRAQAAAKAMRARNRTSTQRSAKRRGKMKRQGIKRGQGGLK
jgi:hypothetical protein